MKKGQEAIGLIFMVGMAFILIVLFVFAFLFIPGCKEDSSEQSNIDLWTSDQYVDIASTLSSFLESPVKINDQELKVKDAMKLYYNDENAKKQIEELGNIIFNKIYPPPKGYNFKRYEFKIAWDGSDLSSMQKDSAYFTSYIIKVAWNRYVNIGLSLEYAWEFKT